MYNNDALHEALRGNEPLYALLKRAEELHLNAYYIGAGCVAQTVWNAKCGNAPMYGISDFDFVYFDACDVRAEAEADVAQRVAQIAPAGVTLDVKNEARVHLWYERHFGYPIAPYPSLEAAIDSWPSTATAVGVRLVGGRLSVYAPFGLSDLFDLIIRPNKRQVTKEIYEAKAAKWASKWPALTVLPW